MNIDEIIRMAREADAHADKKLSPGEFHPDWHDVRDLHFAALVAAAEREKIAAWMMQRGLATGHGETVDEMLAYLEWQCNESEREACALVCDKRAADYGMGFEEKYEAQACAYDIRARGEK